MKKRNILIIAIIVLIAIVIGAVLYFIFRQEKEIIQAPPVERYEFQGMEYEIISVGGSVQDIVTGFLPQNKVKTLAEKIIADSLLKNKRMKETTLLFYSDIISAGAGECDVAEIKWTAKNGLAITMIGE
jgi:hypothetical protein